ncbi:MAG: RNA polymerase sigma factor [Lutibacter sp.]
MKSEADFIKQLTHAKHRDKAFSKLLDLYQQRLYWHIRKIVITHENANDVLQNTFIRVYKSLPKFQQKSALHTWMYRIAYNESIRFLEKNKRFLYSDLDDVSNTNYISVLKEDPYFDADEVAFKLQKLLGALSQRERHIFQLKYYDDLKFSEIAEILEMKLGTIKSSYYKTVKFIEKNISQVQLSEKKAV